MLRLPISELLGMVHASAGDEIPDSNDPAHQRVFASRT